jgi:hypothetical protein
VVASFCLWTRTGLGAVETGHGEHAAFCAVDVEEMAAVRAHALAVGGASALAFALAVLRLVVHVVRVSWVGGATLRGDTLSVQ